MSQCVFQGAADTGTNLDARGRCQNEATRQTDARALGKPEDALELCQEHHEWVKAFFLAQAAAGNTLPG